MAAQMEKQNWNQMANNQVEDKKTNNQMAKHYKTNNTPMDYETNTWHTAYRYTAKKKAH